MSVKPAVARGSKLVEDFDESDTLLRFVFTPRVKLGVLRLGFEYEQFSFGLSKNAPLAQYPAIGCHHCRNRYSIFRFNSRPDRNDAGSLQRSVPARIERLQHAVRDRWDLHL